MAGDKHLLHSVLHYLQKNQFSKSLTRLLKEAKIQGNSWEDKALDLEDIYNKYLQSCNNVEVKSKSIQEQAIQGESKKESQEDAVAAQEINGKKKKKKTANIENVRESKVDEKGTELHESLKEENEMQTTEAENTVDVTNNKKKKKQKKSKLVTESIVEDEKILDTKSGLAEEKPKASEETGNTKEKKKKNKPTTDPLTENNASVGDEVNTTEKKTKKQAKEKKSLESSDIGADDNQISKKRKRSASDEGEVKPAKETTAKESKRRKPEGSEVNDKQIVSNGEITINDPLNLSKNGPEKSGGPKQPKHGSAEPKTVNAFQRVKIDEVEFVDDRLTDNSYWAKEGAEIGYGAKAQEVLGQVKGRDFRHEKTKKKRGSYRGGLIDQGSHSFKYNYSDDE